MASRPESLIFRLATLAGVGDTYSRIRLDLVVNLLIMRAKLVGELSVFGGDQYRPLLHVRDVATAIVPHLDTDAAGIYNLGTENTTIVAVAERIVEQRRRREIHADRRAIPGHAQLPRVVRAARSTSSASSRSSRPTTRSTRSPALIDAGRVKDLSLAAVLQPRVAASLPAARGDPARARGADVAQPRPSRGAAEVTAR